MLFRAVVRAEQGYPRRLCDLIDDRGRADNRWRGMQNARFAAVTGRDWMIMPRGQRTDDIRAAEELNAAIEEHDLDVGAYIEHSVISPLRYGWSLTEQTWGWNPAERRYDVTELYNVRCRNTQVATTTGAMVDGARPGDILVQTGLDEYQVQAQIPNKYIEHRNTKTEPAVHAGLGVSGAAWSTLKMQVVAGNTAFLDRYGLPFLEVTVDDWSSETDKEIAREIIRNYGFDGGIVTAKNARIMVKIHDAIQSARASTSDPHGRFIDRADQELAVLWNGSMYATQSGQSGSSYALAQEQGNVEFRLTKMDAHRVARATERQWFRRWMRANGMPGNTPVLRIFVERIENPKTLVQIIKTLHEAGYPVDPAQIEERTGLRRASAGQEGMSDAA